MYKKKLVYLALASLLPLGSVVTAQEEAATAPAAEQEVAEAAAPAEEAAAVEKPAYDYGGMSMEERQKEREQRYEDLKKRAEEAGVMLPESPPWRERPPMMANRPDMQARMEHMEKMRSMTPEEREAYRLGRYQEMRERARDMGVEMPETPPWKERQTAAADEWAKHMEVIKGMSDEERAACHAMHRRHMRQGGPGSMMRGPGMQRPGYMGQGPGYGYGPGPYPYGPGGNFWDPNQ